MGQLGRIVLAGSSGSPDEQAAAPNEGGGYGELMDEIDQLLDAHGTKAERPTEPDRPKG
jgi:hypothetical protein